MRGLGKVAVVSWRLCADKACVQTSGNCGVSGALDDGAAVGKERHLKAVPPELEDEVIVLHLAVRLEAHCHLGKRNRAMPLMYLHGVASAKSDVGAAFSG